MDHYDILIIGAGAAGIAAAKASYKAGCRNILLVDRKPALGGVLLQCAHQGFGKNKNGPEYVADLLQDFPDQIHLHLNTTVLEITKDQTALLAGQNIGRQRIHFQQLILATGCREIPLGALPIGGTRPTGIYTAGQMQEMMNLHGHIPHGKAVILGSGDLGLIMAAQLSAVGVEVTLVEQKQTCGGMTRNQRCLQTHPITLRCESTIAQVLGEKILEGVQLSDGTLLPCNLLLIAAGLRPEQALIFGLDNPPWLQLCGNCKTVHPMVEGVINEGTQAGMLAWEKIRGNL